MKNVETAYGRRLSEVFLVTIVVQAEFKVPKPKAQHTEHIKTVTTEGIQAIKNKPIVCAIMPVTQTILSPPLSCILPAIGLDKIKTIEYIMKNHENAVVKLTSAA